MPSIVIDKDQLVAVPTVILAFGSIIACVYVCASIYATGYNPCQCLASSKSANPSFKVNASMQPFSPVASVKSDNNSQKNQLSTMNVIIYWMCVVDGIHMLPIIFNWTPQIIKGMGFWNTPECKIIGVVAQFCCIQSPLWHILIAYHLGYLLCGGKLSKIHEQRKYHFVLVNVIPIVTSIIPFILNQYGDNKIGQDHDCWVKDGSQMIFAGFIMLSLLIHYVVLLIAIIQFKKYKTFVAFSFQYYQIVVKLCRFVVVYTVIRFFPMFERLWENVTEPPFWLVSMQHLSIAVLGIANAIVWYWNQRQNDDFSYYAYKHRINAIQQKQNQAAFNTDTTNNINNNSSNYHKKFKKNLFETPTTSINTDNMTYDEIETTASTVSRNQVSSFSDGATF